MTMKGVSYFLKGRLYLTLTNQCNSNTFLSLRGPSFKMPIESNFHLLHDNFEPNEIDIFNIVNEAFDNNKINVSSMDSDEITFAGLGEPLLKLNVLTESAKLIIEKRHGVRLRVKTNGLIISKDCSKVIDSLKDAGISDMSICLASDNPMQYQQIMNPSGTKASFIDMCNFTVLCVEAGLNVTCTAVEIPGVNITGVRALAHSLGATNFISYSYHP